MNAKNYEDLVHAKKEKSVERAFVDPNVESEYFREYPITECINIDSDKISGVTYLTCFLSLLDHFNFAQTFSMTSKLTTLEPYKWGYDIQLLAQGISFGQPLNYVLPFVFNKYFFKMPLFSMAFMRFLHVVAQGQFILAFYQNWYWAYVVGRCQQVIAVQANSAYSNHIVRASDLLQRHTSPIFNILCNDRSMNDIVFFIIGTEAIKWISCDWSPLFMACWIIFGLQVGCFFLTILQNCLMNNIYISKDIKFTDFLQSDVPLTNQELYKDAIGEHNEDYDNLLGEEKFGVFLNENGNKKKFKALKKHKIEIDRKRDLSWEGLERQPQFCLMKFLAIFYMIMAQGVNSYIYIVNVVGFSKFDICSWEYSVPLTITIVFFLKIQPQFMKTALKGYGSAFWFIASVIGTTCYFIIAFVSKKSWVTGYIAVIQLPVMVCAIDMKAKYTLARYTASMPTYYSNTWYNVLNNLSVGQGTSILALIYYAHNKIEEDYDNGMNYLGCTCAITTFLSFVLQQLVRNNNKALKNLE